MTGSKSRYIPIHFDKNDSQNVPIWLQGVPYRVPDDIEQIIQRMHNIQPYEILSTPLRNSVILDAAKLEELKKAVKFVLLPEHLECNAEHCDKVTRLHKKKFQNIELLSNQSASFNLYRYERIIEQLDINILT